MDTAPPTYRDRDPIEEVLYFLFQNWLLLISFPVLSALGALLFTWASPQTFTANLRIPAPPTPLAAFDKLWSAPSISAGVTLLTSGGVEISGVGDSEASAREPLEAALLTVREIASEASAAAIARRATLLDLEARLIAETSAAGGDDLAAQAYALALTVMAADEANKKASQMNTWAQNLNSAAVNVSTKSKRIVLFAAFGGFTFALIIAIARLLWIRRRNTRG